MTIGRTKSWACPLEGYSGLIVLLLMAGTTLASPQRASAFDDAPARFSDFDPPELQFGDFGTWRDAGREEEELAKALAKGRADERVAAARALWDGHSRSHAGEVLRLVSGTPLKVNGFPALKR